MKMKAVIQILRGLLALLWIFLLTGDLLLFTSQSDPPEAFGYMFFTVGDAAMEPELHSGDLALIKKGKAAQPGDVIFYKGPQGPALGRIVGTSQGQSIIQADNVSESKALLMDPAATDQVLVTYLPGFGGAAALLCSPGGIAALGVVGAALIFLPGLLLRTPSEPNRRQTGYKARH